MEKWQGWGVDASIAAYDVYINYPVDHSVSLLKKSGKSDSWNVEFDASLTEDVLDEDPTTGLDSRVPTFHGYSASGNVTAQIVYVNYGTYQDFQDLEDAGVDLKGKIAIAKYGGVFRGLKVKRAQEVGMAGILIYSDPGDDGEMTEENGYDQYPKGPARNPSSVQRGSVQFLSIRPGDPYAFAHQLFLMHLLKQGLVPMTDKNTDLPPDIRQNLAHLDRQFMIRRHPFLPFPFLTRMLSLFSRLSTDMVPRLRTSTGFGRLTWVWATRESSTILVHLRKML